MIDGFCWSLSGRLCDPEFKNPVSVELNLMPLRLALQRKETPVCNLATCSSLP